MFFVYWVILAAVFALVVWNYITEQDWRKKVVAAMVIVPLALRLFLIK